MTKGEIETEVKGWFALLQAKEREITVAELDVRRKNREIAQLEKQKAAAADLAKATEEVKAATTDKDKEAAAKHLADAQKNLAQTVATASKETAKEEKKAEATTAAMAKQADAAPPPATVMPDSGAGAKVVPAAGDKEILEKAAETAAKKSEATGDTTKVEKVVAATEKESAATEQIKSMAEATRRPARRTAAGTPAAVADTSKKAEKMAAKADEASAAKADVKVQLVDYSTQLMSERTALVDRLKLVLDKWEAKGGDPKDLSHVHRLDRRHQDRRLGSRRDDGQDLRLAHRRRGGPQVGAQFRDLHRLYHRLGHRRLDRAHDPAPGDERVAGDFAPVARLCHFQRPGGSSSRSASCSDCRRSK